MYAHERLPPQRAPASGEAAGANVHLENNILLTTADHIGNKNMPKLHAPKN